MRKTSLFLSMIAALSNTTLTGSLNSCLAQEDAPKAETKTDAQPTAEWIPLLKPDSLDGWELTNFGGEGEVTNQEGLLKMEPGQPLTGLHYKGKDFPKDNFEMRWSARRTDGSDFFAGVTFPVGDQFASFICGGWGGGLVGLSSINGNDASENQTASFHTFKNKQWYAFRVQVNPTHVTAWIDDKQVFEVAREGTKFSLRAEVMRSRPLGYCAFQSKVEIKDWAFRPLD